MIGNVKPLNKLDKQKSIEQKTQAVKWVGVILSVVIFLLLVFMLPKELHREAKLAIAMTVSAIVLFITEAFSYGQISLLIILFTCFTQIVSIDTALSGFSSGAIFLIIGGMMIAKAVNDTPLTQRMTYYVLQKFGSTTSRVLAGIILISQVQAFFIPATAVRATLLLPVVISLLKTFDHQLNPNIRRQFMLGVAYGGNISGTAILPAAIGNVLAVEILNIYLGTSISYFGWLLYALPIWILLIPTIWYIIRRVYPAESQEIQGIRKEMKEQLQGLGKINVREIRCLIILGITVLLWMTESFHHMHPAIPAIFAAVVLSLPKIGVTTWENVIKINLDTVFVLGATLSLGTILNETGAIQFLGGFLQAQWLVDSMRHSLLAVILVVIITQIYHLGVSNVSTAIVTLLPVLIGIATQIGVDPVYIVFAASITCLHGFILVIETMPNIISQGSGYITQKEFIVPGIWATVASSLITVIVAATWWKWIGFMP
ncbi:SLC13 family permease [Ammoniphilus resinae]|uniref:Sodium-dependent dicarboxylate transporter SdcS n=1 Tax=Ammoniphilus resinae TaxID=861532 RepID=A0ABS4GLB4_9BACL|nr:DASS family sodium-coupled anion symporter [Ammoniphilus resinae]MBP1931061.1 anion transporter [Ammoniphilus resinae]